MGIMALILLLGGAMAGLAGLGSVDIDDIEDPRTGDGADESENTARGADLLTGTDEADAISGGDGGDWILSFDGQDTLSGDGGSDVIVGGAGADVINAGAGNDFVEAANVVNESLLRSSSTGTDDIFDVEFSYDLPSNSDAGDTVDLGDGDDTVVAGSDDTVTGGKGADEFALGDWIEGGKPVEITDYDEAEDIITFVYASDAAAPEMSVQVNERTGITTIMADGKPVATLRDSSPDFSVRNIAVGTYAA